MREILLFVEDYGHAVLLQALLSRLSDQFAVEVQVQERSATGGHGRVEREFRAFLVDVERRGESLPDLIIVATDANCEAFRERKKRMQKAAERLSDRVVYCIPDPHLERWLLLDSAAFKAVLGKGCDAPDQKCDRDRYKQLFAKAVRNTGLVPVVGGLEHAADIVQHMDLERMAARDASFGALLEGLMNRFQEWSGASNH